MFSILSGTFDSNKLRYTREAHQMLVEGRTEASDDAMDAFYLVLSHFSLLGNLVRHYEPLISFIAI